MDGPGIEACGKKAELKLHRPTMIISRQCVEGFRSLSFLAGAASGRLSRLFQRSHKTVLAGLRRSVFHFKINSLWMNQGAKGRPGGRGILPQFLPSALLLQLVRASFGTAVPAATIRVHVAPPPHRPGLGRFRSRRQTASNGTPGLRSRYLFADEP